MSDRGRDRPRHAALAGAMLLCAVWVISLGAAPMARAQDAAAPTLRGLAGLVYLTASRVCHQRADRSFRLVGEPLPVCARCTGLYVGACVGGLALGFAGFRQRSPAVDPPAWHMRRWLILALVPTMASLVLEWAGGPSSLGSRAITALPLGAAVAVLMGVALGSWRGGDGGAAEGRALHRPRG